MRQAKTMFRMLTFGLVATLVLALSPVRLPKAFAAENYFYATGSTLMLDEIDPEEDEEEARVVEVAVKAAQDLTLRNIDGYFTPVESDDEELWTDIWSIESFRPTPGQYWGNEEDGRFCWNTSFCYSQYSGYEGDRSFETGDTVFKMIYHVGSDVTLLYRNLPVRIDSAVIVDGESTTTVENINMDAAVRVYPSEDYYTITVYKSGDGTINAPKAVAAGGFRGGG